MGLGKFVSRRMSFQQGLSMVVSVCITAPLAIRPLNDHRRCVLRVLVKSVTARLRWPSKNRCALQKCFALDAGDMQTGTVFFEIFTES